MVVNLGESQVLVGQQTESVISFVDTEGAALYLLQDVPYFLRLDVRTPAEEGSGNYITGAWAAMGCYTLSQADATEEADTWPETVNRLRWRRPTGR